VLIISQRDWKVFDEIDVALKRHCVSKTRDAPKLLQSTFSIES